MMTVEVSVTGRAMTAEDERELADRLLLALTTEESAPDVVLDSVRELTHDGVDHAFCAPSCRKVFAEDHAVAE